jgi:phosphatidylglycerol:prolipoprotein diacylglycerol transferase
MYPNLYFFLKDVFGGEPWGFTRYVNSFGFFVALAFVASGVILTRELRRKEKEGLLNAGEETVTVGAPASPLNLLGNFLFGFVVGYKIIGAFLNDAGVNPQEYIFSTDGSWPGGIFLGGLFAALKYFELKKQALPKPEQRKIKVWPHERVGDIIILGAVGGFLGAKIFDNLENWDRFIQAPIANLLAPSGLTFYGGLILAAFLILRFAYKKGINLWHLLDATAPVLMIAYAIGRIGCHVSGDGDWGIFNTAYMLDNEGTIVAADDSAYLRTLASHPEYARQLAAEYGSTEAIPHARFEGPSFLPNWLWAYNYPHNVNEVGTSIPGCEGPFCMQLDPLVFPTPLYEIIACTLLFIVLWALRKKLRIPGQLFGVYMVFNGAERFLVEKIRVNNTYDIFGFHPTQAELISTALIIGGILMYTQRRKSNTITN